MEVYGKYDGFINLRGHDVKTTAMLYIVYEIVSNAIILLQITFRSIPRMQLIRSYFLIKSDVR